MKKCFECEATEDLQEHHVVPRSKGGAKTVTLCYDCHMKVHGRAGNGLNHSKLTKAALHQAKKRGVKLGVDNPLIKDAVMEGKKKQGEDTIERVLPYIEEARALGIVSYRGITQYLNEKGVPSPRGGKWYPASVSKVMKRIDNYKENK